MNQITKNSLFMLKQLLLSGLIFVQFPGFSQEEEKKASLIELNEKVPREVIRSTTEFRQRLLEDPYRPAFHFCLPEDNGHPGDPNGAFFSNGRYHLMYLYHRTDKGFSWGHVSSKDLLHWRHHPDALIPGDGDEGAFSGGAFVDDDGSATLSYWMLWGAKGIGLAKNTDAEFNNWKSDEWGITELKDKTGKEIHVSSSDPSNIWKKDGMYYMLTGNLLVLRKYGSRGKGLPANRDEPPLTKDSLDYQGDRLSLFKSKDLNNWSYVHEFYESDRKWTSKTEDNMCPSFLPLPSTSEGGKESGKHLLLFISHNRGCQYYIGDYKDDKFSPENHGRMSWKDNGYFAPEALVDDKGRQIMWAWIFDDRPDSIKKHYGWTGTYGLPRSLWVGDDGTLRLKPIKELESLRMNLKSEVNMKLESNTEVDLSELGRKLMELKINIAPNSANKVGVKVCVSEDGAEETLIYYDKKARMLKVDTRKSGLKFGRKIIEEAPFELKPGEPMNFRIFIDKSIVEVFINDRQAIARRIYPTLEGTGIKLFSEGGDIDVESVKSWEMMPSNPY
jgi:beta-fructofuranosidase